MMRIKRLIPSILRLVILLGALAFIGLLTFVCFSIPRETHSLRKYAELRAKWDPETVSHFPVEIPSEASLRKFSYFPGYLQAGAYIQLRLRLPPAHIRGLYSQFASKRTKSFLGGDTNRHMNEKDGMPTTFFKTGDVDLRSFPEDFEIMIFDKVLPESERPTGFHWNHGRSHGVAISTNRDEIVYWAESW